MAVDRSGSTDAFRVDQLKSISILLGQIGGAGSKMEIWTLDRQAQRVYGPKVPIDSSEVKKVKIDFLATDPKHPFRGTRPAALLNGLCAESRDFQDEDVRVVLLSDGDNDFAQDGPSIQAAAVQLSHIPKFSITVIGVHRDSAPMWNRLVGASLRNRLTLVSGSDQQTVANEATAIMR